MSDAHPLDSPIWTALTTRQASLAEGGALARRFPTTIGPFAALKDTSTASFEALDALLAPSEDAVLFTPEPITPPDMFLARREIPFLHVFSDNCSAIALYRQQGMTIRRQLHVTVLSKRS